MKMTKEEQAVRMWLLDKSPSQQEFYRIEMQNFLDTFKAHYEDLDEEDKELYVAALGIAVVKFTQYVGEKDE
jgi:hypothetical protein